ncbi:hypothetical protein POL68_40145 [Stigmatella sp. ncwal1]|uniref:Uncharacterized protein n=1 Tax=Stigmatella ashevillensis TaxID=2995309 RepID=A0ABT5DM35_9BACT|nr:hypothetical protein [Stigmatella ashevillena]MDC0714730.1 hypothetical protein [Stigmatella ashevillena]
MTRINQPTPAVIKSSTPSAQTVKTSVAPQGQVTPRTTRQATTRDGFQKAAATPMVLNPEFRAAVAEVLPGGTPSTGNSVTQQQAEAAVRDAFKQQFNGRREPTAGELADWSARGKELAAQNGSEFLAERIFSELNNSVSSGKGTRPTGGPVNTNTPAQHILEAAVKDAFKQQFNGRREPTAGELADWSARGKELAATNGSEFLAERIFSELNNSVSSGKGTRPTGGPVNTNTPAQHILEAAVKDAFKQQFNGKREPTAGELADWSARGKELAATNGSEFLAERIFSELNNSVSSGKGTRPTGGPVNTNTPAQHILEAAVKDAFKQQFNGRREPTAGELADWSARGKELAATNGSEFLAERIFSELNNSVSSGKGTRPTGGPVNTNTPAQHILEAAVKDAFKQQFNGRREPTAGELADWSARGKELAATNGSEFLAERIFSELNNSVSSGKGTRPTGGPVNTNTPAQHILEAAVKDAFKQQFNGKREPTANELEKWSARAKDLASKNGSEFLAERIFTELNAAVSKK